MPRYRNIDEAKDLNVANKRLYEVFSSISRPGTLKGAVAILKIAQIGPDLADGSAE